MKKSDLYKKWGWVLEICEGTEVNPRSAWKFKGYVQDDKLPNFEYDNPECFEFLVTILDDKPVFVGDKLYHGGCPDAWYTVRKEGYSLREGDNVIPYDWDTVVGKAFSWTPPKSTFTLNGEELPCPDRSNEFELRIVGFNENNYHFRSNVDIRKVEDAINKLLQDATK